MGKATGKRTQLASAITQMRMQEAQSISPSKAYRKEGTIRKNDQTKI
jgi:hypothetical protein